MRLCLWTASSRLKKISFRKQESFRWMKWMYFTVRNHTSRIVSVLMAGALLIGSGCGRNEVASDAPKREATPHKGTIALSVLTLTNPFFKQIGDSMAEEA